MVTRAKMMAIAAAAFIKDGDVCLPAPAWRCWPRPCQAHPRPAGAHLLRDRRLGPLLEELPMAVADRASWRSAT